MRIYTLKPGKLPLFLSRYAESGLAIHRRHLGALLGYWVTDVGPLNTLVHVWGYADAEDRAARRARLAADPAWAAFGEEVAPLFVSMEARLLHPASFFAADAERLRVGALGDAT